MCFDVNSSGSVRGGGHYEMARRWPNSGRAGNGRFVWIADLLECRSRRKQRVNEPLDRFRYAVGNQRLPDYSPLGGEMRGVGQ